MLTRISPPTYIIDRYVIAARKTEYGCGNSTNLFIDFFIFLSTRAVQLLAWLRIFVSARSKIWPVSAQPEAIKNAFTLQFLIARRCS